MLKNIFPAMRNAGYSIIYEWEAVTPDTNDKVIVEGEDTIPVEIPPVVVDQDTANVATDSLANDTLMPCPFTDKALQAKSGCKFTVLLKNNMLYDVLLTPNIGVEIPLGERMSVEADWMYARWNKDAVHKYWRIYGGDFSVYTRLGGGSRMAGDRFAGHFIGAYGSMAVYDFQFGNRKGVLSSKWNYAAGIVYKYSHPVTRRLYIEGSLGIGYMWGIYKKHTPIDDCDVWLSTHRLHWLGPTRAGISLVWLIGSTDKTRKGGRR